MIEDNQRVRRLIGLKEEDLFLISYDRNRVTQEVATEAVEKFISEIGPFVCKPAQSTILFMSTLFYSQILEKAKEAKLSDVTFFILVQIEKDNPNMYLFIDNNLNNNFLGDHGIRVK